MTATEFSSLMEEPPGGHNAGRAASSDPALEGRHVALGVEDAQASAFVRDGGWSIVTEKDGARAGIRAHRGVLDAGEHVDAGELRERFQLAFGFTFEAVHSVYRQGRLSPAQGQLRARIDARLLALSRSGANMLALARVLGLRVRTNRRSGGDDCPVLDSALARARAAEKGDDA